MANKLRIKEAILVEGVYDKHTLSGIADTLILTTNGFGIFKDNEKRAFLRRLALTRGLIILTDGDGAGFLIRNHLKGVLPAGGVKHAYIPDKYGKERRKTAPSSEGKLGVEGMSREILEQCLLQSGATILGDSAAAERHDWMSMSDLYALGLSGGRDSAAKRQALLRRMSMPERMSAKAMLAAINALYTKEKWLELADTL